MQRALRRASERCTLPLVRRTLVIRVLVAGLVAGLVLAAGATAGGKAVRATLSGTCNETDKLDQNGALKSASILCKGSGKCACQGRTQLAYSVTAVEPGNGAPGDRLAFGCGLCRNVDHAGFAARAEMGEIFSSRHGIHRAAASTAPSPPPGRREPSPWR